ncbi:glycosyltransferase family 4 protein [Comamonas aquatica]|uniref:glycosyltransferase family 4 protein n=1 Tax=Comamonas aquatica TaxID=225991 RepID=UPI00244C8BF8|nr:glycosyltransferase family 4 protein [Comamonas aquatica]MDH0382066.1 glycosyltransferase family 4 protein [Comamonas aquatica]MDH0430313.1 glycosyltransferase family 4 protein [Comamonas aquatica]MDH0941179.1 glycosyltransferase family 4 protein [Comamonas aquatica]
MLIIANTLVFNGGTTFILRFSREYSRRGVRVGVLVLAKEAEPKILEELKRYADVYFLNDYIKLFYRFFGKGPLSSFLPLDFEALEKIFSRHKNIAHAMGGFGLLFLARFVGVTGAKIKCSVGVYHQNEFMFSGVNYLFAKKIQELFLSLGPKGVIFLNESSKKSYSNFFNVDYSDSTLVPVGIDLPKVESAAYGSAKSRKIVSVGNLVNFKTYNRHIINLMPKLLAIDGEFTYEIYGVGPEAHELIRLAEERGVSNFVKFNGSVPYSDFKKSLANAFLFVGSGTAVVEAAASGVPALIGIESTADPVTYGFLSDVEGFSYNEMEYCKRKYFIFDKITYLLSYSDTWETVASECLLKSKEFSISYTVDGFDRALNLMPVLCVKDFRNFLNFFSLMQCAFFEKIFGKKIFSDRRNQGTLIK